MSETPPKKRKFDYDCSSGLSRDFGQALLFDEATSDVKFSVHGEIIPAHRAILAARSQVFKSMLFGSMKEGTANEVELNSFPTQTTRQLIRFIYTGKVQEVLLEDTVPLMACADFFGLAELRKKVDSLLPRSTETACSIYAQACKHTQSKLQEEYLGIILEHAQEALLADEFLHLDAEAVFRISESDDARIHEIDLFRALVRWYRHWANHSEERMRPDKVQRERLFASIRYTEIVPEELFQDVLPLVGEMLPSDFYTRALQQVTERKRATDAGFAWERSVRRKPPLAKIEAGHLYKLDQNRVLNRDCWYLDKTPPPAVTIIGPSTMRTRLQIMTATSGMRLGIFHPRSSDLQVRGKEYSDNEWKLVCLAGVLSTGELFGFSGEQKLTWRSGITIDVCIYNMQVKGMAQLILTATPVGVDAVLQVPAGVKIAVEMLAKNQRMTIEQMW
mmetsp:Transcript_124132/g.356542  ORF Transcript_124132/g.356542 Transcript_124132/m.356542 type:complete len:447 (-) Transcript_124132:140-1480(-)